MVTIHLDILFAGDRYFRHVINTKTDATHLLDENETVIFTVDSNGYLYDSQNTLIGTFHTKPNGTWYLKDDKDEKIEFNKQNLLLCEMDFFRMILEK